MAIGPVLYGAGLALNAYGSMGANRAARAQARRERAVAAVQAQQVRASGQRAAFEEQRQARLVRSRALALAAASGAGASDKGATDILAGIDAEGAYRAAVRLYDAENEARIIEMTGNSRARAADDQASAIGIGAFGDFLSGAGSMYLRYGGGGPDGGGVSGASKSDYGVP